MREIDFLPEWYKSNKRRTASYRTQCVALGGVFAIMMVWNYFAASSVSRAEAEISRIVAGNAETQDATVKFADFKVQIGKLQKKASTIKSIDSRIDVASVLAELSFLVTRPTVLSKVELIGEKFSDGVSEKGSKRGGRLVRAIRARSNAQAALPLGDVKFKVLISGVAPGASDVMALICKLEDSPYFFQVVPLFSRNKQMTLGRGNRRRSSDLENIGGSSATGIEASEFEISCYLANYRQEVIGKL